MTQHKVVNAGWRRIERLSSDPDHAGLNVTPPDPDQAGLNAKGLICVKKKILYINILGLTSKQCLSQ